MIANRVKARAGTFTDNMKLPIHRWFRYSAGFSAAWVKTVLQDSQVQTVLDPFVGSGTVCLVADECQLQSYGVESHPFVYRLAQGKLHWSANIQDFAAAISELKTVALQLQAKPPEKVPALLEKCYLEETLNDLFRLREAYWIVAPTLSNPVSSLLFLALSAILRASSHVGTAQWQYVLPNKRKVKVFKPFEALEQQVRCMSNDMQMMQQFARESHATPIQGDARKLEGVPDRTVDCVITSPPYANNYDYADATRLEMTFWGEVESWGDLHQSVRQFLIRSSSQHVSKERLELKTLLANPEIRPIAAELEPVCQALDDIRGTKGGNKAYHTMVAAYFSDLANVFQALRRVTTAGCTVCFVVGDSAPYGIYVPVEKWLGELALAAGFDSWSFEKIRDRNVKWKNRKHSVPLKEGRLWIEG